MASLQVGGGGALRVSFTPQGMTVDLPKGVLPAAAPAAPIPAPAPEQEKKKEKEKEEEKKGGDHVFTLEKDMSELVPSDTSSWNSGGTAHLLPAERKKASFNVDRMTEAIYGGKEMVAKRRFVLAPSKKWGLPQLVKYNMTREEVMSNHFKDFIGVHKAYTKKGYRPSPEETAWMSACSMNSGTLTTHMGLFLPTLAAQTNSAQQLQWLTRTMKFQIIGAYAQTELGHGSNVRALQTTCTYDPQAGCFDLHTPTLQAMKFWNSGVGVAATHCVCYAQLYTEGKCHGVHVFFVQLRDENHKPLPGIEIGDCGNKMGDNGIDCGYIRFNHVKVPREHLLGKKSHVTSDGKYVKNVAPQGTDPKAAQLLSYMTMLTARANMIGIAGGKLALCATTAVRYSAVRQQGFVNTAASQTHEAPERQILDYQMQLFRLMKQVALSYAIQFTSRWMMFRFTQLSKGLWKVGFDDDDDDKPDAGEKDQGTDLPEIHASAAGLKGLCTRLAADGMEDCRKCCGGHGYLLASGIAATWQDYSWQVTAEGDFVVMLLQTARFLIKSLAAARAGESLSGMMEYLRPFGRKGFTPAALPRLRATSAQEFASLDFLHALLERRALESIYRVDRLLQDRQAAGAAKDDAWRSATVSLITAAERHCIFFMFAKFKQVVATCEDAACKAVLTRLCTMFALTHVLEGSGWGGIVDAEGAAFAEAAVSQVLSELRPDAVAAVDAFDIPDRVLNSALGRHDGNVYEELYKHARDHPLNQTGPFTGYTDHVRPHLDLKFLGLRGDAPKALKKSMAKMQKKSAKL